MHRLTFIIALGMALAAVYSGCSEKSEPGKSAQSPKNTPIWPCPMGGFKGDNFTTLPCPAAPQVYWQVDLEGSECTPPIIDNSGQIIVGTSGGVKSFSLEGECLWQADVNTHIKSPPALDNSSRIIAPYGDSVTFIDKRGGIIAKETISRHATHHPTVDMLGHIYIYCMEPVDLNRLAPEPPADIPAKSTFTGHIYSYEPAGLKEEFHIRTGIINCPIRISPYKDYIDLAFYGPKLFGKWRPDELSDPVVWKTNLVFFSTGRKIPIEEIEHGIVDMFADRKGIIHFFGHTEHMPYPGELNPPLNEYGFVYRVLLFSYNPENNIVNKMHWPWMTPEEASTGTYKEFRRHFNRVRFICNAEGLESYTPAFKETGEEHDDEDDHGGESNVHHELMDFVESCLYMIMTDDGHIIGGTDSIRCFDVKLNKVIWEIEGDPSTVALGNGCVYCLERNQDDDKCVLTCYTDKPK